MIIGACGFGSTGSSVICDYLSEYNNIQVIDNIEFTWVSETDSLIDLEHSLMNAHNRTSGAIIGIERYYSWAMSNKRFFERIGVSGGLVEKSVNEFIDSITQVKWDWYELRPEKRNKFIRYFREAIMMSRVIPALEKKKGRQVHCYPMTEVKFAINPENFYSAAKKHVTEILSAVGMKPGIVVLNQPFSGNNPQACFPFFEDPYAIVVDRDPRDNYVFARTKLVGRNHFMPAENVNDFITYYRGLRENQPYKNGDERVLSLRFEDLVYEYDNTTKVLRDFLGIDDNPNPKTIFDPKLSVANTQVYKKFPQFSKDIEVIEKALPQYLFPFENYKHVDTSGEMFFGRSPLHR